MRRLPRRTVLTATLAGATLASGLAAPSLRPARAQAERLVVLAHRVHQTVAGTATRRFTEETGAEVEWLTFDTNPLAERLLREASLPSTTVDVGLLQNTQLVPRIAALFEPLDPYMARAPIERPDDVFPGLMSGMAVGGVQVGLPIRHASSGLHYNAAILAERKVEPPTTIEALAEAARACSARREDGTRVTGLVMPGVTYPNVIDLARAWDGEFITPALKCVADQPPMLNAIRMLRALFQDNALPRTFATLTSEDTAVWMQQGRGAFALQSMGRNRIFNDPKAGPYAGQIRTVALPASASLRDRLPVAPAKVEFWGMAIPRNARRKELSWAFLRAMLTEEATRTMALNGNGPVRNATYEDPAFRAAVPYADEERRVLRVARVPMPAFDEAARAADLFREEAEAAVLGLKTPEAAMASLTRRVAPLLPS
jgi:multiple sugar transport system substrate-binding protein